MSISEIEQNEQQAAFQKEEIGLALGRIPSGLFLVTFRNYENEQPDGMLMSWVQQTSFDPPMVMVAVKKDRYGLPLLKQAGKFVIHVVGKKNNTLLSRFYKGKGSERFADVSYEESANTAAPILTDTVAYLECQLSDLLEGSGDHVLLNADVIGGNILSSVDNEPTFHLRKNGFDY